MKSWLFDEQGKQYLDEEYIQKKFSTYEIAEAIESYPNLVRRALKFHGFRLRTHKQAQRIALEKGRHSHPTKGRERSEEEKRAISNGVLHARQERKNNEVK